MAWPARPLPVFISKPAPKLNICNSTERCAYCKAASSRPRTRAPAMMYACREARREALQIAKPLSTWCWELLLPVYLSRAWSKAQLQKYFDEVWYRDEMFRLTTWFNSTVDYVVLGSESVLRMSQQLGPPNHDDALQAALDPAVALMLPAYLLHQHETLETEFECLRFGLRTLYHRYLKTRDHIYICEDVTAFLFTEEGLQKAVQEGLFSGEDEDSRLVAASDIGLIKKYDALRHYNHQHTDINVIETLRIWWDTLNKWRTKRSQARNVRREGEDRVKSTSTGVPSVCFPVSGSQMLMIKMADFLMWDQGLGFGRGPEIMDLTGHLRKDHPLVQQYGFKLPDFTPVIAYQNIPRNMPDCSAMLDRLPDMRVTMPGENLPNMVLIMLRWKNCLLSLLRRSH